jgi:hypothetical protein
VKTLLATATVKIRGGLNILYYHLCLLKHAFFELVISVFLNILNVEYRWWLTGIIKDSVL